MVKQARFGILIWLMSPAVALAAPEDDQGEVTDEEPVSKQEMVVDWCGGGLELKDGRCMRGLELKTIAAGKAEIGSVGGVWGMFGDQYRRTVDVTNGFEIGTKEVTQQQYSFIMGVNPTPSCSKALGPDLPVTCISWNDALIFLNVLSEQAGFNPAYQLEDGQWRWMRDSDGFRLPTNIEWEVAARSGYPTRYSGSDNPDLVAWYYENAGSRAMPVGQRMANAYGLYDMSGNVWEWVWDGRLMMAPIPHKSKAERTDRSRIRTQRGGCYADPEYYIRVSEKDYDETYALSPTVGIRVARSVITDSPEPASPAATSEPIEADANPPGGTPAEPEAPSEPETPSEGAPEDPVNEDEPAPVAAPGTAP